MSDPDRIPVVKTDKMYVGGAFIRSESGKVRRQVDAEGNFVANTPRASRKDFRNAVVAARKAFDPWRNKSSFLRSQILYRIAEILEDRRDLFQARLGRLQGVGEAAARDDVQTSIDRMFWYAGWADKYAQVLGSVNPVASSFFNFTLPEPVGVIAMLPSQTSPLLGLVSDVAPALTTGNTCVGLVDHAAPSLAVDFAEVLAVSDVPGGVCNLLTGQRSELLEVIGSHDDVNALWCRGGSDEDRRTLGQLCADHVCRAEFLGDPERAAWQGAEHQSLTALERGVEWKTTWHPIGR